MSNDQAIRERPARRGNGPTGWTLFCPKSLTPEKRQRMSKKQANETRSESGAGDARVGLADDLGFLLARHWLEAPRRGNEAGGAAEREDRRNREGDSSRAGFEGD